MKIGIDARVLMDKKYSGISFYADNLLKGFLEYEDPNNFHLFYNSFKSSVNLSKWEERGLKVYKSSYPNKFFNYFLQNIFAWPKLDKLLPRIDIFYAPHFNFINLSSKSKFVLTVHDLSFLHYPEFFSFRKNFWHQFLKIKKLLERADQVIAVSKNTKMDLEDLFNIPENKIDVVYSGNVYQKEAKNNLELLNSSGNLDLQNNFINQPKFSNFLENKGINEDFILYLGNVEPRKNISNLIKAYDQLRKNNKYKLTQLIIAGNIGWKANDILKTWGNSPFKNDIKLIGYVNEEEKRVLYQKAKIFVYPSFYEGFGFPPLEAASFAVPVLCSNVSSLPEIMNQGALYIDPFKVSEIRDGMDILCTNEKIREKLIKEALILASSYSWSKTAENYLNIFKKLA